MASTRQKSPRLQQRSAPTQERGKRDADAGLASSRLMPEYSVWKKSIQARENAVSMQSLEKFQTMVDSMRTEVMAELQKSEQALIKSEKDHIQRVTAAYGSHQHHVGATKTSQDILRTCHELLAQHDRTNRLAQDRKHKILEQSRWRQDGDWVQQMISYGRQYGEGVVQSIIFPDLEAALLLDADEDELNEAGREALNIFMKSRKRVQNETWGKVAREQMMVISALASTVSEYK